MAQLQYMEYRGEKGEVIKVRIIDQVKATWIKLVDVLELPTVFVANEKAEPGWTPDNACRNAFVEWLKGEGAKPHTWATVLKALDMIGGYRVFIEQIEHALAAQYGDVTHDSEKKSNPTSDTIKGELHSHVFTLTKMCSFHNRYEVENKVYLSGKWGL